MVQPLSEIKSLLGAYGLRPKHRFGQNFLHDAHYMQRIIEAAEIAKDDLILEVGAGTGSLSKPLLDSGARLVAVEIDRGFAPILDHHLSTFKHHVTTLIGDILVSKHKIDPAVTAALRRGAGQLGAMSSRGCPTTYKLVANLPYQIASPLLVNLLVDRDQPTMASGVVMIQREVADRLVASPGTKSYGPLSVMIQAMCDVERITTVPPSCFWPQPKVDSTIVRLQRRHPPMTDDVNALRAIVKRLFTQRRKQLGTILGRDRPLPEGILPSARPQQLSVADLIALSRWPH